MIYFGATNASDQNVAVLVLEPDDIANIQGGALIAVEMSGDLSFLKDVKALQLCYTPDADWLKEALEVKDPSDALTEGLARKVVFRSV